ncbi:unnamed protein product, partial [Ectocarpus sp. 4 AP-2014]
MHPTHQSQGQGYTHSDSDGSFENEDGAPRPRRGISGQGGVSGRGAGAYRRRRLDDGSGSRRPRRRHRPATGHRAEDLKTYDPRDIGPDEYVAQMATFLERRYLATIHGTIVSAQDQEKDYALAVNAQDLIHFDSRLAYLV